MADSDVSVKTINSVMVLFIGAKIRIIFEHLWSFFLTSENAKGFDCVCFFDCGSCHLCGVFVVSPCFLLVCFVHGRRFEGASYS